MHSNNLSQNANPWYVWLYPNPRFFQKSARSILDGWTWRYPNRSLLNYFYLNKAIFSIIENEYCYRALIFESWKSGIILNFRQIFELDSLRFQIFHSNSSPFWLHFNRFDSDITEISTWVKLSLIPLSFALLVTLWSESH